MRAHLCLAACVFLAHFIVTGGHLQSPDEELMFRQARSLAERGTLAVDPLEYDETSRRLLVPPGATFATVQGRDGRFYAQYLPLQPLLAVPIVWAGRATAPMFAEAFSRSRVPTRRHPARAPLLEWQAALLAAFFNPAVSAATAVVMARLGAFLTGGDRAAGWRAGALWAFATMAWPHSRTFFTEPLAGFFALFAVDRTLRWLLAAPGGTSTRWMLGLGAALAAGIWTRVDFPFLALGIGMGLAGGAEWRRRRDAAWGRGSGAFPWRDCLFAGVPAVLSFVALVAFNRWRLGGAGLTSGYGDQAEGVRFGSPLAGLFGFMASPGKSLFLFSPALVLGVLGWRCAWRRSRLVAAVCAVSYLPFAAAMLAWQNWDGGWCWGPRHIEQLHAPIMLGAAWFVFDGCGMLRAALAKALVIVSVAVQVYGSSQSSLDFYDELFLSPRDGVTFRAPYREFEQGALATSFRVVALAEDGPVSARLDSLPPPLVDSLYIPGLTQWTGNAILWREGCRDWWFAQALHRRESER